MKRLARQAGRTIGYAIHHAGMSLITAFLIIALITGILTYRLSLGPIQIPFITGKLASMVSGNGINIHIARAALAWDGFKNAGGVPFILQLENITANNATGVELAEIPDARLVFFPGALLGDKVPILVSSSDALFEDSTVPVNLVAAIQLGTAFKLSHAILQFTLGGGRIGPPDNNIPINGGGFRLEITPTGIVLTKGHIALTPVGDDAPVIGLEGSGHLNHDWLGNLVVTVNSLQANDLAIYWPRHLNAQARAWITYNITAGAAHDARLIFSLAAPASLAALKLNAVSGGFQADHLSVGWIPNAQPITGVSGILSFTNLDTIDIAAATGQLGGLSLHDAHMRITGVAQRDQTALLTIPISGSLSDVFEVLNAPPLGFLTTMPADLLQATGSFTGTISSGFPLNNHLQLPQVDLTVAAAIRNVTLPVPIEHQAFTNGALSLNASTTALRVAGDAQLAGEAAHIVVTARYGTVSPAINATVDTVAGTALLGEFGLQSDPGLDDGVSGNIPVHLNIQSDLTGRGVATLNADLSKAAIGAPAFGWAKAAGQPGSFKAVAGLNGESITGISRIAANAPGLDIQGATNAALNVLNLTRLRIGGSEASGSIAAPATLQAPWAINLMGSVLDVTAILNPPPPAIAAKLQSPFAPPVNPPPASGPHWTANLKFADFILAAHNAPHLRNLVFAGGGQGLTINTAAAAATASGAAGAPLTLEIKPSASGLKTLHLETADGGNLMRALGAFNDIQGGALNLDANYSDSGAATGVAKMTSFRLMQAPAFTKLLQTLSIYGAAEAASGPGLKFDRMVAPFSIANHILTLQGARAYSKSLGFTASGTIGLADGNCNLDTTVVPVYALNAALGKIPLIGKLFSAEKGGGLFAVRAKITGQLSNPNVSVNPLSALTPGVLRGLFGLGSPTS